MDDITNKRIRSVNKRESCKRYSRERFNNRAKETE